MSAKVVSPVPARPAPPEQADVARARVHMAMLGARQHYALPALLHRAGMLGALYTDLYAGNKPGLARTLERLPRGLRPVALERFLGRTTGALPVGSVVSFDSFGLWYAWRSRRMRDAATLNRLYAEAAQRFARRVIGNGVAGATAVYGYNGAARELFEWAKPRGIVCILEQTIAPFARMRELLAEEQARWPGWEPGAGFEADDSFVERERAEWSLADLILAPSQFVLEGLQHFGVPAEKCCLVPYGIPLEEFAPGPGVGARKDSSLRVLFAGGVELRKGAPYLLEALRQLNSTRLEARFVGSIALDAQRLDPYRAWAEFIGPVPRQMMLEHYRWADLLVLPSVCEGSALVTYEALACGLSLVATPNTGAWIEDGVEGTVVPAGDTDALAAALDRFLREPDFLLSCRRNAFAARPRVGLDAYAQRVLPALREVLSPQSQERQA